MNIEEKAKAYDEAFRVAKELYNNPHSSNVGKGYVCTVFPELRESNNEKIRRGLIKFFESVDDNTTYSLIPKKDILAWLEKQGEQTSIDNIEPKFHKGDWIIHHGTENIYQVVAVIDNQYQLKYGDNYTTQYCEDVDRCTRLWDIKDAKPGDMLATLDDILIFEKVLPEDGGVSYCHYDFGCSKPQFNFNKDDNWYFGKEAKVYPATKEQCSLLFQKMKEAGYEWDAEKKELKKIKQNPTEWSEEDEGMLNQVIKDIIKLAGPYVCYHKDVDWLKSLKDRVQPQSKQEWSEEDEKEVSILEAYISSNDWSEQHIDRALGIVDELVNKVKSLSSHK